MAPTLDVLVLLNNPLIDSLIPFSLMQFFFQTMTESLPNNFTTYCCAWFLVGAVCETENARLL